MNLLLLLLTLLPWSTSAVSAFTRIYVAISIFTVEMQLATLLRLGTFRTLVFVNLVLAIALMLWQGRPRRAVASERAARRSRVWWPALAGLGMTVIVLNLALPLEAADPYHLERIGQIERYGTLEYDPNVNSKVNILGWTYELLIADLRQIPLVGASVVKLHGLLGLALFAVTVAAVSTYIPLGPSRWVTAALLAVPPLFHSFVLLKNDLFAAAPTLVVFAWLIARAPTAQWRETMWAGWLAGFVVACKLTNLPVAVIAVAGLLMAQRGDWRPLAGVALGGFLGAITGGLFFTMTENLRWYGDIFASEPVAAIGNQNDTVGEVVLSIGRFVISLFDMGFVTRRVWPDRGGWGGTFGLVFIWAVVVLVASVRHSREARWTAAIAVVHFTAFAAVYPDADITQRLALGPALLCVLVATSIVNRDEQKAGWMRRSLVAVLLVSAVQIGRSAALYLARGGGAV